MKVEFRFNGTNEILLIPESGKDKQLLQLWSADRPELSLCASVNPEIVTIQASARKEETK